MNPLSTDLTFSKRGDRGDAPIRRLRCAQNKWGWAGKTVNYEYNNIKNAHDGKPSILTSNQACGNAFESMDDEEEVSLFVHEIFREAQAIA
jgi:hypothetical protein